MGLFSGGGEPGIRHIAEIFDGAVVKDPKVGKFL